MSDHGHQAGHDPRAPGPTPPSAPGPTPQTPPAAPASSPTTPGSAAPGNKPGPRLRRMGLGPGGHGRLGVPVEKSRDFWGSLKRLASYLRPQVRVLAVIVVLAIASVGFSVAGPRLLGEATNEIFRGVMSERVAAGTTKAQAVAELRAGGQTQLANMLETMRIVPGRGIDYGRLRTILAAASAVYLFAALLGWLQMFLMAGVAQRVVYRLRREVDHKLGRLPLRYYDINPRGDTLSRVTNDVDNIAQTLQQSLSQIMIALLTILGVLAMMFVISPLLAVVTMLMIPVSVAITAVIARRSQKHFTAQWERLGALNAHIEEMHTGHSIVKVFGQQARAIEVFDEQNKALFESSFRAQFISGIIHPAMHFVNNLNYVAIAVVGGLRVASGSLSLGDVQAFIQYSRQFQQPIMQTASIANVLQSTVASAERVFEMLDEPEETGDPRRLVRIESVAGHVVLDRVSFRYEPDQPLIEDLSLVAAPGSTVAIVGPTGAGKTTLVNLLMRFYELDEGAILIDGTDTRHMARDDLRRTFGMVLQDTWLFAGTIKDNIAYGREGATEDEIFAAARAARVDHFVRTLPDGYDTLLTDEAANLSAGERQLLTIARAFLADPEILILDEATSSVDTRTEVLIQDAMARLMRDRTSFVIAHRLSTIRNADTIIVMDRGRIIEQGAHEELLSAGGFYADLYQSQFESAFDQAS